MNYDHDKPTLFLDVDGVLNFFPRARGCRRLHRGRLMGYPITVDADVINAIRQIEDGDDIVVVWLTTWRDLATSVFSPWAGLRTDTPVAEREVGITGDDPAPGSSPYPYDQKWHKRVVLDEYVRRHLSASTPWVFVDDDAYAFSADADRGRVIVPDERVGLTVEDVCGIVRFLRGEGSSL